MLVVRIVAPPTRHTLGALRQIEELLVTRDAVSGDREGRFRQANALRSAEAPSVRTGGMNSSFEGRSLLKDVSRMSVCMRPKGEWAWKVCQERPSPVPGTLRAGTCSTKSPHLVWHPFHLPERHTDPTRAISKRLERRPRNRSGLEWFGVACFWQMRPCRWPLPAEIGERERPQLSTTPPHVPCEAGGPLSSAYLGLCEDIPLILRDLECSYSLPPRYLTSIRVLVA